MDGLRCWTSRVVPSPENGWDFVCAITTPAWLIRSKNGTKALATLAGASRRRKKASWDLIQRRGGLAPDARMWVHPDSSGPLCRPKGCVPGSYHCGNAPVPDEGTNPRKALFREIGRPRRRRGRVLPTFILRAPLPVWFRYRRSKEH